MEIALLTIQIVTCVLQYALLGVVLYFNHKENKQWQKK